MDGRAGVSRIFLTLASVMTLPTSAVLSYEFPNADRSRAVGLVISIAIGSAVVTIAIGY